MDSFNVTNSSDSRPKLVPIVKSEANDADSKHEKDIDLDIDNDTKSEEDEQEQESKPMDIEIPSSISIKNGLDMHMMYQYIIQNIMIWQISKLVMNLMLKILQH